MSSCICLDTSVLIKILVEEPGSDLAVALFRRVIAKRRVVVLPAFAWAELGTVLRKKCRTGELAIGEADELWSMFRELPEIVYLEHRAVQERAWLISRRFDLPTLYDAAFLAVAEVVAEKTGEVCEYWTADEKLVNLLGGQRAYVRWLGGL
ncbi:type II toxin-antitoxin system VapC family toxin [Candidatus Desulforudis audaxviator]|uniref:PilT protein domain protein n=1 Tax=Desulforudis audaxviator (strain MP104C) TaxID=477974 RepID=B1I6J0_DESAP|nr:type II toxin-antitoxin system VapC family toxin [Candidatus Desulforudis audaxviator]ACA60617.1 PilT protein domain protein [Candidatus Desulforudis audaxviator MP104C]